jgi:hypothetical protein
VPHINDDHDDDDDKGIEQIWQYQHSGNMWDLLNKVDLEKRAKYLYIIRTL